jgi:hypothetical protein
MAAKLYFHPEFGTVVARPETDIPDGDSIEITAEQGIAVSLSIIGQYLHHLCDVVSDLKK